MAEEAGDTAKRSLHNWPLTKPRSSNRNRLRARQQNKNPETALKHTTTWPRLIARKQPFMIRFEFQHLPRNNGRHLPNNSPNNRESPPPAPSPKPTAQQKNQTGRKRREKWRGRCDGAKGWEKGRWERWPVGRRQNNRRGKVTNSRENGKTLTIDMNEDPSMISRE